MDGFAITQMTSLGSTVTEPTFSLYNSELVIRETEYWIAHNETIPITKFRSPAMFFVDDILYQRPFWGDGRECTRNILDMNEDTCSTEHLGSCRCDSVGRGIDLSDPDFWSNKNGSDEVTNGWIKHGDGYASGWAVR